MSSINGFGTNFYGECDYQLDGTYVMTYWVVFAYLPIIPLYSVRLYNVNTSNLSSSTPYEFIKLPIHWKQVLRTWGYIGSWIFGIYAFASISDVLRNNYYQALPILLIFLVIFGFGMTILPTYLRRQAKKRVGFTADQLKFMTSETKRTFLVLTFLLISFGVYAFLTKH